MPLSNASRRPWKRLEADQRVDVQARDRVGMLLRDLLDVHPAHRGEHHAAASSRCGRRRPRRSTRRRCPRPARSRPRAPSGRGCPCRGSPGVRLGLVGVVGELDAARLAAPADLDLGLDHDREAELLGRLRGPPRASSRCRPSGTGTPCSAKSCLPWYSSRSMYGSEPSGPLARQRAVVRPPRIAPRADAISKLSGGTCLYRRRSIS